MGFKEYFDGESHAVGAPGGCAAEQLLRPSPQLLHRLSDVGLRETRHKPDRVEQIRLAGRIRAHDRREWTQVECETVECLETVDFDSRDHEWPASTGPCRPGVLTQEFTPTSIASARPSRRVNWIVLHTPLRRR